MASTGMRRKALITVAAGVCAALVAAACSSGDGTDEAAIPKTGEGDSSGVAEPAQMDWNAAVTQVDWGVPDDVPGTPTGSLGFDRFVYVRNDDDNVIPVLVEGPPDQVRCQDPDLPCSYQDLKAIAESGDEPPAELGMSAADLDELVSQLDETSAALESYSDPATACAAGYSPVSAQNPNMGVHFVNTGLLADGFDPANPEMLLYASEEGLGLTRDDLGDCDGDSWAGVELGIVGSAFFIDLTDEHPEGFAGPLDNWHVHYNSCAGAELDNMGSEAACERFGGAYFDVQPNWMIHAYAAPDHDSQTGVFAMWNDSIWPIGGSADNADLAADVRAEIREFTFGDITAEVGDEIVFTNRDQMPHTVAEGRFVEPGTLFESDFLATDESFAVSFDEPGTYRYFCTLHPTMQGQITVG